MGFYDKKRTFLLYQGLLLLFAMLLVFYAADFPSIPVVELVLLGCTLLIAASGLIYGSLASLALSLVVLFLFGTLLIWQEFVSATNEMSLWEIVLWMVVFPAAALISGTFSKWMAGVLAENRELKEKFQSLVTVDEVTKFDNQNRFQLHL